MVVENAELMKTGFQSAAADRVHDQRKLWRVLLPVRRRLIVARTSSPLETEELGVVAEVGPEVEAWRAVDGAVVEHNSLCVARSPDDGLQVFRAEVYAIKVNFFCGLRCCPWERIDVELRLYSGSVVCIIIDCQQFESCWSAFAEEASEVCVCVWNLVNPNSVEVGQPESGSHAVSHQRFLFCFIETDSQVKVDCAWDLLNSYFLSDILLNVITAVY